jgi:hypothetical protein
MPWAFSWPFRVGKSVRRTGKGLHGKVAGAFQASKATLAGSWAFGGPAS